MALEIQQREREGITVLELNGRITVGPEASALRDKCAQLMAEGKKNLVLELSKVDFIDSTGLGALVIAPPASAKPAATSNSSTSTAAMSSSSS